MKFIQLILAAATLSLLLSGGARASSTSEMCRFVSIISTNNIPAAVEFLEGISTHWSEAQRAKLGVVIGSELEKFNYKSGQIYRTADLTGAVEEYFLVLNLSTIPSSVYARVLYEGDGNTLTFINIDVNSDYYDITSIPFAQEPKRIGCPAKK